MKLNHTTGAIAFLLATPLVTSLSVGVAPSSAATIAGSAAAVTIDHFSHTPTDIGTFTNTNTQTIANSGAAISQANAEAFFISNCHELLATNLSQSEVIGSGNNYSGLAQSQAAVIGEFFIDAEETFSFTFQTFLALLTSVDNPQSERARAHGSISFLVLKTVTNILLDSFQFAIGLDSSSGFYANAFLSNSFKPTQINFNFLAEGSAATSLLYTSGVYSRTFNSPTKLTLVEVKNNIAEAEAVPEPSTVLGTAIFLGLFVRQRKHKKEISKVKSKV